MSSKTKGKMMFLQNFGNERCCLCGNPEILTGEHKIKASALRDEFGKDALAVGTTAKGKIKYIQSANAKRLKFEARLCEACNSSHTQPADWEFDDFRRIALDAFKEGESPMSVFDLGRYAPETQAYLNVFRYFAKLLSCHMAEVGSPIPIRLAQFAVGGNPHNCIWLEVKGDPMYQFLATEIEDLQYAAHGGLTVMGDKITSIPKTFHSTLTIGPIQYVFFMDLYEKEVVELEAEYFVFYDQCISAIEHAKLNPMTESSLLQLGLKG